jgi:hypothetical protein
MTAATCPRNALSDVVEIPERFRLRDDNPLTWRTYAESRVHELPPYVWHAIESTFGVTPTKWNELVRRDEVHLLPGAERWFSLARFLQTVRARGDQAPKGWSGPPTVRHGDCPDCAGTLAVLDTDSSVTGRRDGVFLCICAR